MQTPTPEVIAPHSMSAIYPGNAEQARAARVELRGLLGGHPLSDDVLLCASELAANAILHSQSGQPGGKFTLRAELNPDGSARIEVEDQGGPWTDQAGISPATIAKLERQPSPHCHRRTLIGLAHALREHPAAITRGFTHPSH